MGPIRMSQTSSLGSSDLIEEETYRMEEDTTKDDSDHMGIEEEALTIG